MTPREFDRTVPVAASRFLDLLKSQPSDSLESLAEKAWEQAEAFDQASAKRDPGEIDKPRRVTKGTA